MAELEQALDNLKLGELRAHEDLSITPLLLLDSSTQEDLGYVTLDEAIGGGTAHFIVPEPKPQEHPRELIFRNQGDTAVLLLDGEELLDDDHKYILNHHLLARPKTETPVMVTRVEKMSVDGEGGNLSPGLNCFFYVGRQSLAEHVSEDLDYRGERRAKHRLIEVANKTMQGFSRSRDFLNRVSADNLDLSPAERLERYIEPLTPESGQVGAIFHRRGRPVGIELFDCEATTRKLWPKLVRSYALGTLNFTYGFHNVSSFNTAEEIFECLSETGYSRDYYWGHGTELRFAKARGLDGGAIVALGRIAHLSVFAVSDNSRSFRNQLPTRNESDRELGEMITATEIRLEHVESTGFFLKHQLENLNEEFIELQRERRYLTLRLNELIDQLSEGTREEYLNERRQQTLFGLPDWAPDDAEH